MFSLLLLLIMWPFIESLEIDPNICCVIKFDINYYAASFEAYRKCIEAIDQIPLNQRAMYQRSLESRLGRAWSMYAREWGNDKAERLIRIAEINEWIPPGEWLTYIGGVRIQRKNHPKLSRENQNEMSTLIILNTFWIISAVVLSSLSIYLFFSWKNRAQNPPGAFFNCDLPK